jgi:plasmid stabilization system protein ParE
MLTVHIHPESRAEFLQARDYYREIDVDLAIRVLDEIDSMTRFVVSFPEAGSPLFEVYRHAVLPHFPYMIVYQVARRTINVLGVFHVRRDPAWMRQQLSDREDMM